MKQKSEVIPNCNKNNDMKRTNTYYKCIQFCLKCKVLFKMKPKLPKMNSYSSLFMNNIDKPPVIYV